MHKNSFFKRKKKKEREMQSLTDWIAQEWTAADA
jgi:hypothetical protein